MPTLNDMMSCTIGGTSFRLDKFAAGRDPIVKEGSGLTGYSVKANGEGVIEASSAAAFATALSVFTNTAISGQNFSVTENGATTFSCLTTECVDGGPHFSWQWGDNNGLFSRRITFTLQAKQGISGSFPTSTSNGWKTEIATAPSGLRTVTRTGQYAGPDADNYYFGLVRPTFVGAYKNSKFVVTEKYSLDNTSSNLTFTLTAKELSEALPVQETSVDGSASTSKDRDEQGLTTTLYSFDLVVAAGNFDSLLDTIRNGVADSSEIVRERVETTIYSEPRLRAQFETLSTQDDQGCIFYEEEYQFDDPSLLVSERRYPGLDPIIIQEAPGVPRLTQTGRAVGLKKFIAAPDPLFSDTPAEPARVNCRRINAWQCETTWTYVMLTNSLTNEVFASLTSSLANKSGVNS